LSRPRRQTSTASPQDVIGLHQVANYYNFAKCLAVQGSNSYDGAPAFQYDCVDGCRDQVWQLR